MTVGFKGSSCWFWSSELTAVAKWWQQGLQQRGEPKSVGHALMRQSGIHWMMIRELLLGGPSNQEKSGEWENANAAVLEGRQEGGSRELQTVSHTFQSLERLWRKSSWKSFHTREKRVIWNRQHLFTNDRLCLTHLVFLYDKMIDSADKEQHQTLVLWRVSTQCLCCQIDQVLTAEVDRKVG